MQHLEPTMISHHFHDLRVFEMSDERGFLAFDPIDAMPPWFSAWDDMGRDSPKLLMTDQFRPVLEAMPILDFSQWIWPSSASGR